MRTVHRIGSWRFDPDEPVLHGTDGERRLEDRAARTLEVLCARRGQVVRRDELIAAVWNNRAISANSVAVVIGDLRRALGDDPRTPSHILTVPKRGYRLAAPPEPEPRHPPPPIAPPAAALPDFRRRWRGRIRIAAVAAAAAVGLLGAVAAVGPSTSDVELLVDPTRNDTGRTSFDPLAASLGTVVVDRTSRLRGTRVLLSATVPPRAGERRLELRSRLILWNGAPELALTVTDRATDAVVWSGFAAGPPGDLARSVADRLGTLRTRSRS